MKMKQKKKWEKMKKLTGIAWHSVWQRARAIIEVEGKEMYHNNRIQLEVQH